MPDENKFEALRNINYTVPQHCGGCIHGSFMNPQAQWGRCTLIKYEHKKTKEVAGISIVRAGRCDLTEPGEDDLAYLGAHSEFLEKR